MEEENKNNDTEEVKENKINTDEILKETANTFNEVKDCVILTEKFNGLPQSKDHCKGRFFGMHIHERNFLYRKFK